MKRRNREVGVFSMSALDLFASALGAFILIAIVMFPHYPYTSMASQSDLDEALGRLREAMEGNDELARIHDELNEEIGALRAELSTCRNRADGLAANLGAAQDEIGELRGQLGDQAGLRGELGACREENTSQRAQIEAQQDRIDDLDRESTSQQARIDDLERRKFLLVTISWNGGRGDDVDLHIVDPNGNEYYFGARTHSGSDARFEEDSVHGPGNEVWLQPQVIPGAYRVYYNPFSLAGAEVRVRGRVVHPATRHEFRERRLVDGGSRELVATVVVDDEGNVRVNE